MKLRCGSWLYGSGHYDQEGSIAARQAIQHPMRFARNIHSKTALDQAIEPTTNPKDILYNQQMQKQMGWDKPFDYHFDRGLYYHEVHPALLCGTQLKNAEEVQLLQMVEEIDTVINLQRDKDGQYWGINIHDIEQAALQAGIRYKRVPVVDFDGDSLRRTLPKAVALVRRELEQGHRVYIHCTAGLGRAPAVCIAYVYWLQGATLQQAYDQVTSIRPCQPRWHSIRGATFDLVKGPPMEALDQLHIDAFINMSPEERALIGQRLRDN